MKQVPGIRTNISSAKDALRKKGFWYTIKSGIDYVVFPAIYNWYYKTFHSSNMFTNDVFELQGKSYNYYYHRYERTVEIPIAWNLVKQYQNKKILEVGNVLSWYFDTNHDILDKYERAKGVINQDIVDFAPSKKYDLIVSISTLEHVGWDETPRDPKKIVKAFEKMKDILEEDGMIFVTIPIGYNDFLDNLFRQRRLPFTEQYFLMRISKKNKWREVDQQTVENCKYDYPFPAANGLIVGVIRK